MDTGTARVLGARVSPPHAMKPLTRRVLVAAHGVNWLSRIACGSVMAALTVVVLLQVLYRYVLELPLVWSDEAARHLLVWLSLMGGGIAVAEGLNPRIEMIDGVRSPRVRQYVEIFVGVLVLAFLAVFIVVTFDVVKTYNGYRSLALGIPQSVPRLALPVGGCLMAVNVLAKLLARLSRRDDEESLS